jgi:SAM-dependent methyltransferase
VLSPQWVEERSGRCHASPTLEDVQPYSERFFADHEAGARRSAGVVVPLVVDLLAPASVVDVGCGLGTWLSVFREHGVEDVVGVDGAYVDRDSLAIPADRFLARDLTEPLDLGRSFDLAVSLEVAEHLPERAAQTFVDSLARLAPAILFSAAIPEQDGAGHVYGQWPSFWRGLFAPRGLRLVDCVRTEIWSNDAVEFWYRQNMLLFVQPEVVEGRTHLQAELSVRRPLDVVHPAHWSQVMHQARLDREAAARASSAESA